MVGVFYKYKFNEVDDFIFFALLFLSIIGKEISKPPKIIVNLHISSTKSLSYYLMYFETLDIYVILKSCIKNV